jgi:hypothetical protein
MQSITFALGQAVATNQRDAQMAYHVDSVEQGGPAYRLGCFGILIEYTPLPVAIVTSSALG